MRRVTFGLICGLFLLSSAGQGAQSGPVPLRDLAGNPASISDHTPTGEWLVVIVWATTCQICAHEIPQYGAYHTSAEQPEFKLLGIALDGHAARDAVVDAMRRWNMTFPSLVAELPAFSDHYAEIAHESLKGTPTFMLFSPSGKLVGLNPGRLRISALEAFIRRRSAQIP